MPRGPDLAHKATLLDRATNYLLAHGLTSVSLRDLAEATGVSSRMLVHHFGSKEHLLVDALGEARRRQRTAFEARLKAQLGRPYAEVVADAWRWMNTDEAAPYLRLFGELHALATAPESPYAEFARHSVTDWLPTLEAGFLADGDQPAQAQRLATLTLAVTRGLLLDRNALEDRVRVNDAQAFFVQLLSRHRSQHQGAQPSAATGDTTTRSS
ncbi:MAG: TetR/AcrR family transcriptional regulator [Acidimicrobiales bacterium]